MKKIVQGLDNFKKLIDVNAYYVDKTLLIKDMIDSSNQIVLMTRPRRFGKTLNMSMLRYFFEKKECRKHMFEDVDTAYLFEDLKIWEQGEKYRNEQGQYPTIYLTLKNAKQNNWNDTYENLKAIISDEYRRHSYVLEGDYLNKSEQDKYKSVMNEEAQLVEYTNILKNLSEYLKRYFKKDCMIIIDEYDTPIQAGYLNGYFEDVIEFMKSMLVKGFKDNYSLKQGILTGIMKVAQESIFSDFNNPLVCTVLSNHLKTYFGFTEDEVEEMANNLGLSADLEMVKEWYNGYIFGQDTVIYNPWSIIKYMGMPEDGLKPYWVNTSGNQLIKEVLQLDMVEGKEVVQKLLKGEEVKKVIEENIVYQRIKTNPNAAWSFLLHAGYLKAYEKELVRNRYIYKLEIPNNEVRSIYEDVLLKYFEDDIKVTGNFNVVINALIDNDIEKFERVLQDLYLKQVSYYDVKAQKENFNDVNELSETEQDIRFENFHHGFFLGLFMYMGEDFIVDSNKEYGLGRPDLVIIPKDAKKTAYVFEFKWESTKGPKPIEKLLDEAMKQIEKNKYAQGVHLKHGNENVVSVGIGFKGKELKLHYMKS
jgi:hypothetical protein